MSAFCACAASSRARLNIYLAGAMTGHPDHNFPAFNAAAATLRAAGHTVFNPAEMPAGMTYREYLGAELAWMCAEGDAIALLPGWEKSKGATAEHATAIALGLRVLFL
jgi:hypothetical protein